MNTRKLKAGTWYYVTWIDAQSDADSGDPKEATIAVRQNMLRYLRTGVHKWRGWETAYHVFAYGFDQHGQHESGWLALPEDMLVRTDVIVTPKTQLTATEIKGD